jgi:long-chain fatty acid transport protein
MKTIKLSFIFVFLVLFLSATFVYANSFSDTFGMSPKGVSLGNAMCAKVNDWSSVYYNVSGLGKTWHASSEFSPDGKPHKNQLAVSYLFNLPQFDIDIERHGDEALATNGDRNLDTGSIIIGGVIDLTSMLCTPDFVSSMRGGVIIGLNDDQTVIKVNDLDPRTHNFLRYGRESQKMTVMSGVGIGFLNDTFGIGLGVNSSFSGSGAVVLEDVEFSSETEQTPPGMGTMDLNMDQTLLIGAYFSPLEFLDFGISYRQESMFDIMPLGTTAFTSAGNIGLQLKLALFDYYQPEIISAGTALSMDRFTISFDLEYQKWSGFKLSDSMEANFQDNYGESVPQMDDIIIPKIGIDYQLYDSTDIFGGYYYQQSFIPDGAVDGVVNFLDNNKHVFSAGFAYRLPKTFLFKDGAFSEISAGYQLQYLENRKISKAAPDGFNPEYSYGGTCHSIIMGISVNL